MITKLQRGFSIVEIAIVIVVVGLIGFLGWRAWEASTSQPATEMTSQVQTDGVPAVQSANDLNTVDSMLDESNVDGEYEKELEAETAF